MLQHKQTYDVVAEGAGTAAAETAAGRGPIAAGTVAVALAVLVALALTLSVLLPRLAADVAPTSSGGSLAAGAASLLAGDAGVAEPEARLCWLGRFC